MLIDSKRLLWYIFLFLTEHNLSFTLFLICSYFLANLRFDVLLKCVLIKKSIASNKKKSMSNRAKALVMKKSPTWVMFMWHSSTKPFIRVFFSKKPLKLHYDYFTTNKKYSNFRIVFMTVLVFKLWSRKVLFVNRKNRNC